MISCPNIHERRRKEENQMAIMLTVIVAVFLTCNIFGTIVWLLFNFFDMCQTFISYLWTTSIFLQTVNSSSNVIIYATLSRKFRKNFVQLFFPSFMQKSREQNTPINIQLIIAKNFPKNSSK